MVHVKRGKTKRYSINYELIYGKPIGSRPRKRREKMVIKLTQERLDICLKCLFESRNVKCKDKKCLVNSLYSENKKEGENES